MAGGMWKWMLLISGLLLGGFVGFELAAWIFFNRDFDAGGIAGFAIGLPLGALIFAVSGFFAGRRVDRAGGWFELGLTPWHGLAVIIVLVLIAFLVRWMSSIRPFFGFQT